MAKKEPELCSDCPFRHLIPKIQADRVCYTTKKEKLTNHKLCRLLRAYAVKHRWVSLKGCPYYTQTERIDLYATA